MNKIFFTFLLAFVTLSILAQSVANKSVRLKENDLLGRWIESERIIDKPNDSTRTYVPSILIFKEDGMFHRGEDTDGVVLFSVTGKYKVSADSISVNYFDMGGKYGSSSKMRKMIFVVERISSEEMVVRVTDSWHSRYTGLFTRQGAAVQQKTKKKSGK